MDSCGAGPCPNGHMGIIIDGTYTALDKLYAFFKSAEGAVAIPAVEEVARAVSKKRTTPEQGLEDIADLLPTLDLKASVKKLGSKSALAGILIVLTVIGALAKIGSDASTIYKNLSPSAPAAPAIIINNNPTNINTATAGHGGGHAIPPSIKREQARRLKQMHAKKDKLAGKGKAQSKKECD